MRTAAPAQPFLGSIPPGCLAQWHARDTVLVDLMPVLGNVSIFLFFCIRRSTRTELPVPPTPSKDPTTERLPADRQVPVRKSRQPSPPQRSAMAPAIPITGRGVGGGGMPAYTYDHFPTSGKHVRTHRVHKGIQPVPEQRSGLHSQALPAAKVLTRTHTPNTERPGPPPTPQQPFYYTMVPGLRSDPTFAGPAFACTTSPKRRSALALPNTGVPAMQGYSREPPHPGLPLTVPTPQNDSTTLGQVRSKAKGFGAATLVFSAAGFLALSRVHKPTLSRASRPGVTMTAGPVDSPTKSHKGLILEQNQAET